MLKYLILQGFRMRSAVFLDRDGTVCEEMGYINHIDRLRLYPWSVAAIARLNRAAVAVVVVTNQGGAAMGYFPEILIQQVHDRLRLELAQGGAKLDAIYYCPHHPHAVHPEYRAPCDCRKPAPGMLRRAERELSLDLKSSYIVGDRYRDLETGFAVEARGVMVLSGYGKGEYLYDRGKWPRMPDHIADDLTNAVDWILEDMASREKQPLEKAL